MSSPQAAGNYEEIKPSKLRSSLGRKGLRMMKRVLAASLLVCSCSVNQPYLAGI